ncbi:thermonuclease family protein [Candidatus Gracilibacteria bacterium]|nr:thermonuclease family protein [Candidatus Gracilibacteria bacterium]
MNQLGAYEKTGIIEIQSYGKIDTCFISDIDDGDTFDLDCGGGYYPDVRLLGVNTPDFNHVTEGGNCYYNEARTYIAERRNKIYNVKFYGNDLCKDPFKGCRNLVQLTESKTHTDLGQMMILRGFAFSWTNFSIIPENLRETYNRMEKFSSANQLGLWKQCNLKYHELQGMDVGIPRIMTSTIRK